MLLVIVAKAGKKQVRRRGALNINRDPRFTSKHFTCSQQCLAVFFSFSEYVDAFGFLSENSSSRLHRNAEALRPIWVASDDIHSRVIDNAHLEARSGQPIADEILPEIAEYLRELSTLDNFFNDEFFSYDG